MDYLFLFLFVWLSISVAFAVWSYAFGPAPEGKVEQAGDGLYYRNEYYDGYIAWNGVIGVRMYPWWRGRRLTVYGEAEVDFKNARGLYFGPNRLPFDISFLFCVSFFIYITDYQKRYKEPLQGAQGLRLNRYERRLEVYPSKHFDIERLYRDLLLRGIPAMQTVKLPRA